MEKFKALFMNFIKPTPFKVGLLVMLVSTQVSHIYYQVSERRRPEAAEIDKRKLDKPFRETVADWITLIHQKSIDLRFRDRGLRKPNERVVILAVDEKAVGKLGRWPWPRGRMADAIERLVAYGVSAYGFDAVFSEEDTNQAFQSLSRVKDQVEKLKLPQLGSVVQEELGKANTDWKFAQSVNRNADKLVMGTFFSYADLDAPFDPDADKARMGPTWEMLEKLAVPIILDNDATQQQNIPLTVRIDGFVTNIPQILQVTRNQGYFNAILDSDGLIRRSALVTSFAGTFFPSLALQMSAVALNGTVSLTLHNDNRLQKKVVESLSIMSQETGDPVAEIPVNQKGVLEINYAGPRYMFPHMSIADVLLDASDPETKKENEDGFDATIIQTDPVTGQASPTRVKKAEFFKDKVVVFGATAIGIYDLRNSPFDEIYPGVETHANVISNILNKDFLQPLPTHKLSVPPAFQKLTGSSEIQYAEHQVMLLVQVVFGIILASIIGHVGAVSGLLLAFMLYMGTYLLDKHFLFGRGYIVTIVLPLLQIGANYVLVTFYKYFTEERNKKQIKGTFEKYVSPEVVKQILNDPSKLALGGEKRRMTVMFSDVRGFTTLSEKMEATELGDFLNSYLTPMTDLVFKNKGTLDKYMGDAIMSFFGAPIAYADHAKAAAKCALDMMSKLEELKAHWAKQGLPPIDIGIGINTGEMSVGNMGSNTVRSYTVMGDSVNLGSRLEGINKDYGTHIIVSEFTNAEIKESFVTREVDWVRVKGKEKPVKIFELVCEKNREESFKPLLTCFNSGYDLFRQRQFDAALKEFQKALEISPQDGPSLEFIDRCEEFIAEPPPADWNGVVVKKTK